MLTPSKSLQMQLDNDFPAPNANSKKKKGLAKFKKTMSVEVLQRDKDNSSEQKTITLFDPIKTEMIDVSKNEQEIGNDLLILENYDVTCYYKHNVKFIMKYNYRNCPYQPNEIFTFKL